MEGGKRFLRAVGYEAKSFELGGQVGCVLVDVRSGFVRSIQRGQLLPSFLKVLAPSRTSNTTGAKCSITQKGKEIMAEKRWEQPSPLKYPFIHEQHE